MAVMILSQISGEATIVEISPKHLLTGNMAVMILSQINGAATITEISSQID